MIASDTVKKPTLLLALLSVFVYSAFSAPNEQPDSLLTAPTDSCIEEADVPVILPDCPCCPLHGKVISPFGYRGHHRHTGTDVKCKAGDTIRAAFQGKATMAATYYGYGKLIILQHEKGIETYYSHLSKCLVEAGDSVSAGQPIGLGGRSGRATTDHLHFEIRFAKKAKNSEKYFDFARGCVKKDVFSPTLASATVVGKKGSGTTVTGKTSSKNTSVASSKTDKPRMISYASGQKELFISSGPNGSAPDSIQVSTGKAEQTASGETPDFILIQKGDTLYSLARKYGTTVKDLQALNNMDSNFLKIGMKLKLR